MQHLNFTYQDAYRLEVWKRLWFITKLKGILEEQNQDANMNSNNNSNKIFKKQFNR